VNRAWPAVPVAVVLTVVLTGCLSLGGDERSGGGGTGTNEGQPERGAVGNIATADPRKTIAKATFDSVRGSGEKLEIGILELRVTGKLSELTLTLTPRSSSSLSPNVYELNGSDPAVSLIDDVNLKRYVVVKDTSGKQLQPDYIYVRLRIGQPNVQTYYFSALPANVRTVDLVFGRWPPFRDVPVTR